VGAAAALDSAGGAGGRQAGGASASDPCVFFMKMLVVCVNMAHDEAGPPYRERIRLRLSLFVAMCHAKRIAKPLCRAPR
jgi:hypothetical protein